MSNYGPSDTSDHYLVPPDEYDLLLSERKRKKELEAELADLWAFVRAVNHWETRGGWKFVLEAREALAKYEDKS